MTYYGIRATITKKDKTANDWSGAETEITYPLGITISLGLGTKKDSFSMSINNYNATYFSGTTSFDVDDRIRIWLLKDQTWSLMNTAQKNNALAFDGLIVKSSESISANQKLIKLTGKSFIETIFNTRIPLDKEGTPPEIIQEILTSMANFNGNRVITWYSGNPLTRSDSSAHDTRTYYKNYKPVIEMLEELSSDKYTKDGQYIFWLESDQTDGKIYFHWTYKDNVVPANNVLTEGTDIMNELKVERSLDDVINAIIFNAGRDAHGNTITGLNYRQTAQNTYGNRMKYILETSYIGKDLVEAEKKANPASFTQDAESNFTDDHFPISYASPYTMRFKTRDVIGTPTASAYTVTNDSKYNAAIRTEARWIAMDKTSKILDLYSAPRYKAEITIPRPAYNTHQLGKLVELTSSSYNLSKYKLRLTETRYDFWKQVLVLEEDEKTAIENLII